MAKMGKEIWVIGAFMIAAVLLLNNQQPAPVDPVTGGSSVDLCALVEGEISFTGVDMLKTGTARTSENVRVIRMGSILDLGQISMNSGTISTTPKANYKLYYGENSTSTVYYTTVESYEAPCQDAPDNKVGALCTVDNSPSITVYDENGQPQSTTTENIQAVGADGNVDIMVRVKVAADKCYGNPTAPGKNAICFDYNATDFDSVTASTPAITSPHALVIGKTGTDVQSCYELDLLKDTEDQYLDVNIQATSVDPDSWSNITVTLADIAFDLDQDDLTEIWGFEDEDNNDLGDTTSQTTEIRIS